MRQLQNTNLVTVIVVGGCVGFVIDGEDFGITTRTRDASSIPRRHAVTINSSTTEAFMIHVL